MKAWFWIRHRWYKMRAGRAQKAFERFTEKARTAFLRATGGRL